MRHPAGDKLPTQTSARRSAQPLCVGLKPVCSPISTSPSSLVRSVIGRGASVHVARLDTGSAALEPIADSTAAFEAACADPANVRDWFLVPVVEALRASGKILAPRQCYGFTIIGFVCVLSRLESEDIIERDREHAYVTDLVVLEPYRKAGIASELMRVAEAQAFSSGARRLRVGVLARNNAAHSLYRKLGYRDREIVLEKTLGPTQ